MKVQSSHCAIYSSKSLASEYRRQRNTLPVSREAHHPRRIIWVTAGRVLCGIGIKQDIFFSERLPDCAKSQIAKGAVTSARSNRSEWLQTLIEMYSRRTIRLQSTSCALDREGPKERIFVLALSLPSIPSSSHGFWPGFSAVPTAVLLPYIKPYRDSPVDVAGRLRQLIT